VTTAGMREPEMEEIATLIDRALGGAGGSGGDDAELRSVREDAATLCSKFPPYAGLGGLS